MDKVGMGALPPKAPRDIVPAIHSKREDHAALMSTLDRFKPSLELLAEKHAELEAVSKELDDANENLKMLSALNAKKDQSAGAFPQRFKSLFSKGGKHDDKKSRTSQDVHVEKREVQRKQRLEAQKQALIKEQRAQANWLAEHQAAQAELYEFYASIFDGPTHGYPEEDQAEAEVRAMEGVLSRVLATHAIETSSVDMLTAAVNSLHACQESTTSALHGCITRMLGDIPDASFPEKQAMQDAHANAADCQLKLTEARATSPAVKAIGPISIAESPLRHAGLPTKLFHGKLIELKEELENIALKVSAEHTSALARARSSQTVVNQTRKMADEHRERLLQLRQKIFEQVLEHTDPPPPETPPQEDWKKESLPSIDPPLYTESPALDCVVITPSLSASSSQSEYSSIAPASPASTYSVRRSSMRSVRSVRSPLPATPNTPTATRQKSVRRPLPPVPVPPLPLPR